MVLEAKLHTCVGERELQVELDTRAGTLVVVGPNGAGKTTLLETLLGAHRVSAGRIVIGGQVILDTATGVDVALEQRAIAYVPQGYGLFSHLSVQGNVEFALRSSEPKLDARSLRFRVHEVLAQLDCAALAQRGAEQLSGGERQRVALARALVVRPRALLLDEPLSALDVVARRQVRDFLAAYLARLALPCVIVTHDPQDAKTLGARVAVMEAGRITQQGSWDEIAREPGSEFARELVSAL